MYSKVRIPGWILVLSTIVMSGCAGAANDQPAEISPEEIIVSDEIGLANPASVFCGEQGYTLEMRTDANGTQGVCIFPDGSECEEWAFFRGECAPASERSEAISVEEASSSWQSYTNSDYGFSFRYPATWTINERSHQVELIQNSTSLIVGYRSLPESVEIRCTGVGAGDFQSGSPVTFMGTFVDTTLLVYEGNTTAAYYGEPCGQIDAGDVVFSIMVADSPPDYADANLSLQVLAEVAQILESFDTIE